MALEKCNNKWMWRDRI